MTILQILKINYILEFYNVSKWVTLKKQTGRLFAPKILKDFVDIDEIPPALERYLKAETELKSELSTNIELEMVPLMKLSSLPEHIHIKTRETSQNTDLHLREFLGIIKPCSPYRLSW